MAKKTIGKVMEFENLLDFDVITHNIYTYVWLNIRHFPNFKLAFFC